MPGGRSQSSGKSSPGGGRRSPGGGRLSPGGGRRSPGGGRLSPGGGRLSPVHNGWHNRWRNGWGSRRRWHNGVNNWGPWGSVGGIGCWQGNCDWVVPTLVPTLVTPQCIGDECTQYPYFPYSNCIMNPGGNVTCESICTQLQTGSIVCTSNNNINF